MKLYLQVKSPDGTWETLNERGANEVGPVVAITELMKMRDDWRATKFPTEQFRIYNPNGKLPIKVSKPKEKANV